MQHFFDVAPKNVFDSRGLLLGVKAIRCQRRRKRGSSPSGSARFLQLKLQGLDSDGLLTQQPLSLGQLHLLGCMHLLDGFEVVLHLLQLL